MNYMNIQVELLISLTKLRIINFFLQNGILKQVLGRHLVGRNHSHVNMRMQI